MFWNTLKPKTVWHKTFVEMLVSLMFAAGSYLVGSLPLFLLGLLLAFVIIPARGVRLWLRSYAQTEQSAEGSQD